MPFWYLEFLQCNFLATDKNINTENYYLPLDVGGLQASSRIELIASDWDITAFNMALSTVGGGKEVLKDLFWGYYCEKLKDEQIINQEQIVLRYN